MNAFIDFDIWINGTGFGFTIGVMELYNSIEKKDKTVFVFHLQIKLFGKELINYEAP